MEMTLTIEEQMLPTIGFKRSRKFTRGVLHFAFQNAPPDPDNLTSFVLHCMAPIEIRTGKPVLILTRWQRSFIVIAPEECMSRFIC